MNFLMQIFAGVFYKFFQTNKTVDPFVSEAKPKSVTVHSQREPIWTLIINKKHQKSKKLDWLQFNLLTDC